MKDAGKEKKAEPKDSNSQPENLPTPGGVEDYKVLMEFQGFGGKIVKKEGEKL